MKYCKKIYSLLLATLTIVSTVSMCKVTSFADEKAIVDEEMAKKMGVKVSDIEFSNIDLKTIDRLFNKTKQMSFDTPIGIASESIETTTFSWWELMALYNVQSYLYDLHVDKISKSTAVDLTTHIVESLTAMSLTKFGNLFGIKIATIYSYVSLAVKLLDNEANKVMTTWLRDGRDLLYKAANSNKKQVTLKYVKLTWKTSGHSIITGGMILK